MIATFIFLFFASISFSGNATHDIESEVTSSVETYTERAYIGEKEITVNIKKDSLFFHVLEVESYAIDSIQSYGNNGINIFFTDKGGRCSLIIDESFLNFYLHKFGEKHIFTLLY